MVVVPARQRMEIRKLKGGEWCVDLGRTWFRVRADGTVIAKRTTWRRDGMCGSVKERPATSAEAKFAKGAIATYGVI